MDGSENEKEALLTDKAKKNGDHGSIGFNISETEESAADVENSKKNEYKNEKDQITDTGSKASKAFGGSMSAREAWKESYKILKTLLGLLFANTTKTDKLILIIGTIFAIIQGAMFTYVAVIFGSMTNSFIQQSIQGYANSTTSADYTTKGLHNFSAGLMNFIDQPVSLINSKAAGISEKLTGVFDLVNKIIFEAFTERQALTKEEFTHYVSITGQLFLVLALVALISSFFQVLCWECVASNQKLQLRESVVIKILKQDMTWFESHDIGEMISNVFGEVGFVREALGFTFCSVIENLVMFVCTSMIAFAINWRLALVFLAPTPFRIFQSLFLAEKISGYSSTASKLWDEAEDCSSEALANMDTVIAFGEQLNYVQKFGSKLEESIDNQIGKCHLSAIGQGILQILIYGSYGVGFWYCCRLLMQDGIKPGEICTIFLAVTMGTLAMSKIFNSISVFGTAFGSAKNLKCYAEPPSNIDCLGECGNKMDPAIRGEIEFQNVSFGYNSEKMVFQNLTFKIEAGKTVAILAECGEGKTTIANLLIRLYDANEGDIKVDGKSIKEINVKNLRKHIAVSLQAHQLTPGRVFGNIKAGRTISLEAIQNVLSIVDPLKFVLDIDCDPNSLPASRKRTINLARSIVGDPSVLILDESFLDLEFTVKAQIRKNILDHRKGKTTILLTSDVLSLEDMDLIYVLKDGQILKQHIGTHAELLIRDGSVYKVMHDSAKAIQDFMNKKAAAGYSAYFFNIGFEWDVRILREPPPDGYLALYDINSTMKKMWALGILGCMIVGLLLAAFAFYFVEIYGTFSKSGDQLIDDGVFWAGMLLILAFLSGLGVWLRCLFMNAAALYLALTIRTTAFGSILRRPREYYDQNGPSTTPSSLGSKAVSNTPYVRHAFELQLPEEISTFVTLFGIWIIISCLIWQIGIIDIFGVVPILITLATLLFLYQKKGRQISSQYDDDAARLLTKAVGMIQLVQTYVMQEFYIQKYKEHAKLAIREAHKQAFVFAILFACCQALFFLFFGVSFLVGSYLITNDIILPEYLFRVFFAVAFCIMTFNQTVSLMPDLGKAAASLEQINSMIREEYNFDSNLDALNEEGEQAESLDGKIEFSSVMFNYSNCDSIFISIDMKIEAGSMVAITGPSSFGGTTLLYLILRFYDPSRGKVIFDHSKKLKDLNLRQVREQIGWIPQQISLFQGSLADNLKYGCTKPVTPAQLIDVLRTVQLFEEFGNELDSYEDDLYWNSLSKVKRVLIAIARAILRDPKILLIDSPTTSMSLEDQMKVTEVIKTVKENRTCIIISRIPYTISIADKIIVIKDGKVIEEGKLEELLQHKDGYYSNWLKTKF